MARVTLAVLALGWALAAPRAHGLQGWWIESFDEPLGAEWSVDVAPGARISAEDGLLRIVAPMNTFAHIERDLDADSITATLRFWPSHPAGVSWATGVFLYWDTDVWCHLAIVDHGGGVYYTAERTGDNSVVETQLGSADLDAAHELRVELGRDCVRYSAREAAQGSWKVLRAVPRHKRWARPPSRLIVGKGFGGAGSGDQPAYDQPDLDNSYPDPGPECIAFIESIAVRPTPAPRQRLLPGEAASLGDADGEAILALPGDPTYDQVAALHPPMRHVREAVGPKAHPDEIGVTNTGALELQGRVAQVLVGAEQVAFGSDPRPSKSLLSGYLPVVVAQWERSGTTWEQTVLGHSEALNPDAPLYALVRLAVLEGEGGDVSMAMAGHEDAAVELGRAAPGKPVHVRVPFRAADGRSEPIGPDAFDAALEETILFWEAELARGMRIRVPDERLMDAYRAWLCYNAIDVDKVGEHLEPHDGAHFYEEVYGYSAARYAWALDLWGRHEDAEAYLDTLMAAQQPDGLLSWNFGLTDTGALLCVLAEHYHLTGDADWLRRVAPQAAKACQWLRTARREQRGRPTADPGVTYGLITFRSYCDYPTPVCGYLHNAYCAEGMTRIGKALREAGVADAEWIELEAARYRRDVLRSMGKAAFESNGRTVIPLEPDTHRLLKDCGYRSTNYYTLVASTMLECLLPEPGSPEARAYVDFLLAEGGIQLGTCEFIGGIDHAYGYGYMLHQLLAGEPERFLLGVWTALAYGMTRETYSSVEVTLHKTGENFMTLPHLYSGTQQLFMLRTMLLHEVGDDLLLCPAVPREWLAEGKRVEVTGAKTRFGEVSFSLASEGGSRVVRAAITPPDRRMPGRIILRLRHPDEQPIQRVTVNGAAWTAFSADEVSLPAGRGRLAVAAYFGK